MGFDKEKIHKLYPGAEDLMYEPMLIWKTDKHSVLQDAYESGEYFLELKIDGYLEQIVRTEDQVYMFSRAVSKATGLLSEKSENVPHIKEAFQCLPPKTIIIGEIYLPGGTSKNVTTILGCLPQKAIERQKENKLQLYCHDIIMYDGVDLMSEGAETRYQILEKIWHLHKLDAFDFLRLAVKVDTELEAETSRILDSGGEGVVLKKRTSPYVPGKRPAHMTLKVKQMDSIDLVCCGLCDATMEYTGKDIETWPYWRVENDADGSVALTEGFLYEQSQDPIYGKLYTPVTKYYYLGQKTAIEIGAYDDQGNMVKLGTVSSGLTDRDKELMTENPNDYIGKVVSLDCMSINKSDRTLRHPVFKTWREDKNAIDCRIDGVFK